MENRAQDPVTGSRRAGWEEVHSRASGSAHSDIPTSRDGVTLRPAVCSSDITCYLCFGSRHWCVIIRDLVSSPDTLLSRLALINRERDLYCRRAAVCLPEYCEVLITEVRKFFLFLKVCGCCLYKIIPITNVSFPARFEFVSEY